MLRVRISSRSIPISYGRISAPAQDAPVSAHFVRTACQQNLTGRQIAAVLMHNSQMGVCGYIERVAPAADATRYPEPPPILHYLLH
jgi:hypothetical protein